MGHRGRDLVDEAQKRAVLLLVCVVGLAYLMSLTSSSIWINMPIAASLILFLRYITSDLDVRRHTSAREKLSSSSNILEKNDIGIAEICVEDSSWRSKVNSPVVETAIDHFNRHIVSEWVTDLWYSRITPDEDGPKELVKIMNNVFGEISHRARDINLINLLIRDMVNLLCNHLELFRSSLPKIRHKEFANLPEDVRDLELRLVLAAENNLHPALISAEAEHKVLQHLMGGLISFIIKPENLQCSFFRYIARELLACVVMRPVINLANPRIINEKIENFVLSFGKKTEKDITPAAKDALSQIPCFQDPSSVGVELVKLTREDLPRGYESECKVTEKKHHSDGDCGHVLVETSSVKTQALSPEHLQNMLTNGRYYRKMEIANGPDRNRGQIFTNVSGSVQNAAADLDAKSKSKNDASLARNAEAFFLGTQFFVPTGNSSTHTMAMSYQRKPSNCVDHEDIDSECSYGTEDDESTNVTGLDSPGTRVWDSKSKANAATSHIHHPLESSGQTLTKKSIKGRAFHPRASRTTSGKKRYPLIDLKDPSIEEHAGSSFSVDVESDYDLDVLESVNSVATPFARSTLASEEHSSSMMFSATPDYSFLQLRCEVLGANIVKSGSGTFAVYSVTVVDADKSSWSIKRRFRHFEDLHRRLKEFLEYNLSLPPKHFLSTGLEMPVIQERCELLDRYLKNLLQLPRVSRSIEVWDFLSVDSQTYTFADSLSIIQTLSVALDQKPHEKPKRSLNKMEEDTHDLLQFTKENFVYEETNHGFVREDINCKLDGLGMKKRISNPFPSKGSGNYESFHPDSARSDTKPASSSLSQSPVKHVMESDDYVSESLLTEASIDPIPSKWVQQNLSLPIIDLVDVIFQLQDGGWIRRQAFWVAKQVLQLGMGDALDDWLLQKMQLLRKGSVIASVINRVEQILWPDGIFITKHPSRRRRTPEPSPKDQGDQKTISMENQLSYEQQSEAVRRAKFVRELIIDKAPTTLVSVIGRKEYERSAEDIYLFLQSSVCLKQLAFELLELILLAAFPELEDVVRHCHEDKESFGSFVK